LPTRPAAAPAAVPPPPSRRAKLILVLGSVLLALAAAEAGLRVAGVSNPNFYQPDPVRGWGLAPGAEGWWLAEGRAYVRINGDGERDVEHAVAKPPGVLRVAVLGDSCTEALQVPVEQTFWKLLEPALASCPALAGRPGEQAARVEVLNFGVAGYGTAQELLTLRQKVWKYAPDVVVLAFYTGNDVRNNYRRLEQDPGRPYFVPRGPGGGPASLALDDSFRSTWGFRLRRSAPARALYALFNHSRVMGVAKRGKGVVDGWIGAAKARRKETGEALQELGLDNAVYSPPRDDDWRQAWEVTEAILAEMRREVAARGAAFGLLSLSTGMQVHPDPDARRAFMRRLGIADLSYPDRRLAAWGAARGVPTLALAPPLAALAARERVFLHGFPNTAPGEGHWNARGHAAAAPLVAGWLCRELLAPAAARAPAARP
jgi:hypothetical protein